MYCDAAWRLGQDNNATSAGLGVFIQLQQGQHCNYLYISAASPPVSSVLQAEAFALLLAAKIADLLDLQESSFYTNSSVLVKAVTAPNLLQASGHWDTRPLLANIQQCRSFKQDQCYHIPRSFNYKSHHEARLARKIQHMSFQTRCLEDNQGHCPFSIVLTQACVHPFTLLLVKCT